MSKPTCLFLGRFQPYHIGHHMVIKGMTKLCKKIIIGIGSSDKFGTSENPYTAQERKEMIQQALQDEDIIPLFDVVFVNLPDHEDDAQWTKHVLEQVGPVDMIWTGNEDTKKCFEGKLEIKDIKEVPGISSTAIRQMIKASDMDWKTKVPGSVVKAVQDLGYERIK
ncbi:MAG TPA: adenylyltransferase/cytidyltransferase family protein [Patescibacteria group bacterium]|nr:adenylyltransferase/cytidyltransferase family protein [Patescibacteria group bacterium]